MIAVLHRTAGWIAVEKPAGALVIPGRGEASGPALRQVLEAQLGKPVWVVHRLDRDTSGVLLFALDAATHRTLSMAFESGEIRKHYAALVEGHVEGPLELHLALVPARRGRMRVARNGEEGKAAHTRVRPVEAFGAAATLVDAEPFTGRQHQIRVHLAAAGHPLLVDPQYGRERTELLERTPLHASRLEIPALEGIERVAVSSPLPEDMAKAIEALRAQRST